MSDFSEEFLKMASSAQGSVDRIYEEMWRRWAFAYLLAVYTIRHG